MSNNKEKTHETVGGQIEIAEEVISVIAVTAALEVEGISTTASKGFTEFFGKRAQTRCIRIEKDSENNTISIGMDIVVHFGMKVPVVAEAVQEKIKSAVETMTGMTVEAVNIIVVGIIKEKPAKEKEKEEV